MLPVVPPPGAMDDETPVVGGLALAAVTRKAPSPRHPLRLVGPRVGSQSVLRGDGDDRPSVQMITLLATVGFFGGASAFCKCRSVSEFFPEAARQSFAVKIICQETAKSCKPDAVAKTGRRGLAQNSATVGDGENLIGKFYGEKRSECRAMRTMVGGGGSRFESGLGSPSHRLANLPEILVRTTRRSLQTRRLRRWTSGSLCSSGGLRNSVLSDRGRSRDAVKLALRPAQRTRSCFSRDGQRGRPIRRWLPRRPAKRLKRIVMRAKPETWNVNDSWASTVTKSE